MSKITVLPFIKDKSELINCVSNLNVGVEHIFKECCDCCFDSNFTYDNLLALKIDTVVDFLHDELNTGHWSQVPTNTRRAFTVATFIKACIILQKSKNTTKDSKNEIEEALKCIDLGILLGAPINNNEDLLTLSASFLNSNVIQLTALGEPSQFKRKASSGYLDYLKIKAKEIQVLECPSLETFNKNHFLPQLPVKLKNCIPHWPANTKWADVTYLLRVAGSRTVPIELGSHYTESNWSQKLMSLSDFIKNYYSGINESSMGYLAQHNLFDQISELKNDICIPDYCALSRNYETSEPPDINAWFGPKGTLSPLHYDPKDNLLAQVFGTKQVILFAPGDSKNLYPHDDMLLFNTAQIDPLNPELTKYLKFAAAVPYKCLLEEGQVLYIPPKWWHHIAALDKSFSVSFWWQ